MLQRILILFLMLSIFSCKTTYAPLDVVSEFDVKRYTGTWHEIARLPNSFEKGLVDVTATYGLLSDGKISVVNKGRKEKETTYKEITGKASIPDATVPAKLKVTFFWPFAGDYWVLAVDKDYQYALVGDPSRKYLWILSRTPTMEDAVYKTLVQIAVKKGFDASKVERLR